MLQVEIWQELDLVVHEGKVEEEGHLLLRSVVGIGLHNYP